MEAPPTELGPFLAYKLNGQPISVVRGGPVRMIVRWAHGFKSIKWLQRLVLTNNFQANDTYANGNNDVESHLKTAAYVDTPPATVQAGRPLDVTGTVMAGLSGLKRGEYSLRTHVEKLGPLRPDYPAVATAKRHPCPLPPAANTA